MKRFYLFLVVLVLCTLMFGCGDEGVAGILRIKKPVVILPDVTLEVAPDNSSIIIRAAGGDFNTLDFLFCGVSDIDGVAGNCKYISRVILREFTFTNEHATLSNNGIFLSAASSLLLQENKQYNFRFDAQKRNSITGVTDSKSAEMFVVTHYLSGPVATFPVITFAVGANNKSISAVIGDDGDFAHLGLYFCGIGDVPDETCSLILEGDRAAVGTSILLDPSRVGSSSSVFFTEKSIYNFRIDIRSIADINGFVDEESKVFTAETFSFIRPSVVFPQVTFTPNFDYSDITISIRKILPGDFDSDSLNILFCGTTVAPTKCVSFHTGFISPVKFTYLEAGTKASSTGARSCLLLQNTEYLFRIDLRKSSEAGFFADDFKLYSTTTFRSPYRVVDCTATYLNN